MDKLALFLVLGYGKAFVLKMTTGICLTSGLCCVCSQRYSCAPPMKFVNKYCVCAQTSKICSSSLFRYSWPNSLMAIELCHDAMALLFWTLYIIPFRPVTDGWEHALRAITGLLLIFYSVTKFLAMCLTLAFRELLVTGQVEMAEKFSEVHDGEGNQVTPTSCCFNVEDEKEEGQVIAVVNLPTQRRPNR